MALWLRSNAPKMRSRRCPPQWHLAAPDTPNKTRCGRTFQEPPERIKTDLIPDRHCAMCLRRKEGSL